MPYGSDRTVIKLKAGEALTDMQHMIVTVNSDGECVKVDAAAGEFSVGILETGNDAAGVIADDSIVSVCVFGKTKVSASGALAAGVQLTSATDGQAAAIATNQWMIGWLMEDADAADHLVAAFITGPSFYNTD
jgi:hypothetical protein